MQETNISPERGAASDNSVSATTYAESTASRRIYFAGLNYQGAPWLTMDFATGKSRDDFIADNRSPPLRNLDLRWPKHYAVPIFCNNGEALREVITERNRLPDFAKRFKNPAMLLHFLPSYRFLPYVQVFAVEDATSVLNQLNKLEPLLALSHNKPSLTSRCKYR